MIYLLAGLVIGVLALMVVVTMQAGDLNEQRLKVASLEPTMVLQQKFNDQIDNDITRLENRTREMAR